MTYWCRRLTRRCCIVYFQLFVSAITVTAELYWIIPIRITTTVCKPSCRKIREPFCKNWVWTIYNWWGWSRLHIFLFIWLLEFSFLTINGRIVILKPIPNASKKCLFWLPNFILARWSSWTLRRFSKVLRTSIGHLRHRFMWLWRTFKVLEVSDKVLILDGKKRPDP